MMTLGATQSIETGQRRSSRVAAIDLLRGLTLAAMILVNDNGYEPSAYWPLRHAEWNGCTPTDLIFPTFLFLVGVSTVYSTEGRKARGASRTSLLLHAIRRAGLLFLFGLIVNSFPLFHLSTLRVYGVLPRIAICYLAVSIIYGFVRGWKAQLGILVLLLGGYWVLMTHVPVPGAGLPGRDTPLLDPNNNIVAYVDRLIFTPNHLFERTRDPEGLLSTISALGTTLIGLLAGQWLRGAQSQQQKIRGIIIAGLVCVCSGLLWSLEFPLNKKLWTSSYVLFAAGMSLLGLGALALVVDRTRARTDQSLQPGTSMWRTALLVFGTNAIAAYIFSELLASVFYAIPIRGYGSLQHFLYRMVLTVVPNAPFASLVYSLAYVALCWAVIYLLYRRNIFLKI